MSEFVEFNFPGYSSNEDRARVMDKFCIFCQRNNVQFINLKNCEHANILEKLLEIKILQLDQIICSWCHSILKKINNFKIQALESLNILNSGLKYNIKNYPQNLKLSKIEQQSATNSQPIEFKTIDHSIKSETFEIGTDSEIKIEQDYSDFENDLPLTQISKTIQNNTETDESSVQIILKKQSSKKTKSSLPQSNRKAKSNKKPESTNKPQIKKRPRCEDKVKIIVMSEEEMLEDRKLDALNSRYLKLPYKCEKCLTGFDHEPNLIEHMEKRHKKLKYNIKNYPQNLKLSKIEQQSATNSQPIEFKTIDHSIKSETFEIGTDSEIKIEQDYSDFENDLPLTQISKTIQNNTETDESSVQIILKKQSSKKTKSSLPQSNRKAKSNKKPESTNKPQIKKRPRCEDKVKIIVMSEEEMLEDRKLDALNSRYLKWPYKCEKCLTGFDHEPNLIEHMEKRHKKLQGGHVCRICESVLNTKLSFEEHYKRHYRRYECMQCGKRRNNVYSVLKHYSETHGKVDMTFSCKLCEFTTDSHRSYRYHREKHRASSVACTQCGNTFVTKSGLRVHMLTVHKQSSRIYSCEPCGKVYSTKSGLSAHLTFVHADLAPAYCVTCDINFRSEAGLKHHLKTASRHVSDEAKRYTCSDCDAKFLTKKLLREHIDWVHLNCTTHTCNKCSKSFKNERNLKRHLMFVHEKIRPPRNKICDHCGRGFTSWSILRSHIRTHTGERPLQCPHCAATFAHSAALYTHNKLLHNKQK